MLISDAILGLESCFPIVICPENNDVGRDLSCVYGEVLVGDAASGAPGGVKIEHPAFVDRGCESCGGVVNIIGLGGIL